MKKKPYILEFIFIFILLSQLIFSQNNGIEQITVPLSYPDEPGVLIIDHYKGSINVTGYDGDLIVVKAKLPFKGSGKTIDNMKRISSNSIQLSATEKNNEVTVQSNSMNKTIDLDINIPHNCSLRIQNSDNGKITARSLTGEMEISNINGEINLENISGSAVLNTVDGNIFVIFNEVNPNVPMAFTTIEGNIDVSFPENLNAIAKMKSDNGEIFCTFDMALKEREQKFEKSAKTGSYKVFLEEWTYGVINKSGPEFLFKSYHGNIYIRSRRD